MLVLEYKVQNPKKEQITAIEEAIRTTQFIRNKCIRFWMDAEKGVKINGYQLNKYSTTLREEFSFVKELSSMACQAAAERAWFAISRFYDNCKTNKPGKKGFPRFQHDNRSVEYKTSGWTLHETKRRITFTDKKGIGELKLMRHLLGGRIPPKSAFGTWDIQRYELKTIKRVRIVRRADGYYVQFCVAVEVEVQPRSGDGEIGLDVGLEYFYSDSNGHHEENPRFLRKAEKSIKKLQRRISKKKKGSSNRRKARQRLQGKHLKISRQRQEHALVNSA